MMHFTAITNELTHPPPLHKVRCKVSAALLKDLEEGGRETWPSEDVFMATVFDGVKFRQLIETPNPECYSLCHQ